MDMIAALIGALIGGGFALLGAFYQNKNAREVWARDLAETRVQAARERYSEFIQHFEDWEVRLAERYDNVAAFEPQELAAVYSADSVSSDVVAVGYRTQALSVAIPSEKIRVQIKRLRERMTEIVRIVENVRAGQRRLTRTEFEELMFEVRDQADGIMVLIESWDGSATRYQGFSPIS